MRATPICAAAAMFALALPAVAAAKDRDHDRMPDRWEAKYGLNTHKNDARGDKDHDGLRNLAEYRAHTNPRKSDTDRDGIKDGNEQAGTVASFDQATSTLTINLAGGGTLSGKVNDGTEIECDDSSSMDDKTRARTLARHGADDGPNHDQGDDNGNDGPNHDQNDDHGDDNSASCGVDALTAGRQVKEAEITGDGTSTIFEKVELGPTA